MRWLPPDDENKQLGDILLSIDPDNTDQFKGILVNKDNIRLFVCIFYYWLTQPFETKETTNFLPCAHGTSPNSFVESAVSA